LGSLVLCRWREKLKNFSEQYEIREQHFLTQLKTKDLERKLLEAKLKQQMEIAAQEALKVRKNPTNSTLRDASLSLI
jgi:predicted Holliday junction resolvase-like endonuclease